MKKLCICILDFLYMCDDVHRAARQKHEPDTPVGPSPAGLVFAGAPGSGRHRRKARARQPDPAYQA